MQMLPVATGVPAVGIHRSSCDWGGWSERPEAGTDWDPAGMAAASPGSCVGGGAGGASGGRVGSVSAAEGRAGGTAGG